MKKSKKSPFRLAGAVALIGSLIYVLVKDKKGEK